MLGQRPIIAFAPTTQPERARGFYADTLGLELNSEDAFALTFDAGGTMLRVVTVESFQPQTFTILGWIVDDIAASIRELTARGVTFKRFDMPWMEQDELGVWRAPEGAQVAWFSDPDGNTLSLTQL